MTTRFLEIRRLLRTAAVPLAAGLAALGLAACGATEAKPAPQAAPAPSPVAVTWATAEERELPRGLEVTGTLSADARTEVAAETTGRVVQVLVERGQAVAAGQVIARLDRAEAEHELAQAEATEGQTRARLGLAEGGRLAPADTPEVRQKRATLERAQLDNERYQELAREGVVSRSDLDAKRTAYMEAKEDLEGTINQMRQLAQQLRAQQAQVALKRKALADTEIRAPYAGLVAERHANVGDLLQRGSKVATVVKTSPLRAELTIPETAAAAVRAGQKVSFTVQTYPDRRFEGTIKYVGPSLSREARSLVAEAVVPNGEGLLKPGLFAAALIELPGSRPAVLVPETALTTQAGVSRVYVVVDGRAEERLVQPGDRAGGLVEIHRGVQAGERVVTTGAERLADGVMVAAAAQAPQAPGRVSGAGPEGK
jgi:RND family efflux transporter MFP subunit